MSVYIENNGQYLAATLVAENGGTVPGVDVHKFITYWYRWDSADTPNALNFALNLESADGGLLQGGVDNNTHDPACEGRGDGTSATKQPGISGAYVADTWYMIGIWCFADDGVIGNVVIYEEDSNTLAFATDTWDDNTSAAWNDFEIGRSVTATSSEDFKGWVADAAIWIPADESASQAIMDALFNSGSVLRANEISGTASPDWYDELTDGIKNNVGTALTNNGSATFNASIHPPFAAIDTFKPQITIIV